MTDRDLLLQSPQSPPSKAGCLLSVSDGSNLGNQICRGRRGANVLSLRPWMKAAALQLANRCVLVRPVQMHHRKGTRSPSFIQEQKWTC